MNPGRPTYNTIQPLLLGISVAIGVLIGFRLNDIPENSLVYASDRAEGATAPVGRIEELIRFIENKYVDTVNSDVLVADAIAAVFSHLDPHSVYLTPAEVLDISDQMEGSYAGIGVENFMIDDTVNIASVLPNSPASRSGIQPFDKIVAIDGRPVAREDLSYDEVRALLRQTPGTKLSLNVLRNKKRITIPVVVGDVEVKSVHAYPVEKSKALYVRVDHFGSTTYREFMEAIETHMGQGQLRHLIFDVRDNPGGYLPEATNILCQLFTEKDRLLLYTEGRNDKRNEYKTNGKQFFNIEKIAVLINEESASASEIIAGAIQDWDRGLVIGRRSYGKGLVQEQYPLTNGGAVRLTVSRYYTPSGRSIQRDYSDREAWEDDFGHRFDRGEFFTKDTSANTTPYATLLRKRNVRGGGGIYPDIFIPMESVYKEENAFDIRAMIPEFAYLLLRDQAGRIPTTLDRFTAWQVDDSIGEALARYVIKKDPSVCVPTLSSLRQFYPTIKMQLGRWRFGSNAEAKVAPVEDVFVRKAVDVLTQPALFPDK